MSGKKSNPPRLAIWWLRHACPGSDNNALTGDLIERFHEGQSVGWLWRQVLSAFAVGVVCEIQRHWPHFLLRDRRSGNAHDSLLEDDRQYCRTPSIWVLDAFSVLVALVERSRGRSRSLFSIGALLLYLPWRHCLPWRLRW